MRLRLATFRNVPGHIYQVRSTDMHLYSINSMKKSFWYLLVLSIPRPGGFGSDKRVLGGHGGAGTGGRCVWGSLDLGSGMASRRD
jgi:hypothetical protein